MTCNEIKKPEKYNLENDKDNTIKNRCEPCHIIQVLEVISAIKNIDIQEIGDIIYNTTMDIFFPKDSQSLNTKNTSTFP